MNRGDPIAAIATAPGRSAIGIVRVSGGDLSALARKIAGRTLPARQATRTAFHDAAGAAIDEGIAVYYPAPRSYTGEDVLELQGHGGTVVLRLLLARCVELGARIARPGEFTERAFMSGKLDLAQAEGVIDLIDASTTQAARSALRSLRGEFSARIDAIGVHLVEVRALAEARLDFPEEDLDADDGTAVAVRLAGIRAELAGVAAAARRGSLLREGLHIVLAGRPNSGKSSLLNALAGDDVAIVSDVPGTTRDVVREVLDIEGVPVHVSDTAGLRDPGDPIETIGIDRAWGAIRRADLVLLVMDARIGFEAEERSILERIPDEIPHIRVFNKIDLTGAEPGARERGGHSQAFVSARTGAGVERLRHAIVAAVGWDGEAAETILARARHVTALQRASAELANAAAQRQPELVAEHLRLAHEALMTITGAFVADDLLGEIFARFCIGK